MESTTEIRNILKTNVEKLMTELEGMQKHVYVPQKVDSCFLQYKNILTEMSKYRDLSVSIQYNSEDFDLIIDYLRSRNFNRAVEKIIDGIGEFPELS